MEERSSVARDEMSRKGAYRREAARPDQRGAASLDEAVHAQIVLCDAFKLPGLVIDESGRALAQSLLAGRLIEAGDVIRLWNGRLQAVSLVGDTGLAEALGDVARAARDGLAQCLRHNVAFDSEGFGHLIKLSLVQGVTSDTAPVLVTLRPLREASLAMLEACEAALARSFDLTAGEIAVGRGLAWGRSVREIAEERWTPIEATRREMTTLYLKINGRDLSPPADANS